MTAKNQKARSLRAARNCFQSIKITVRDTLYSFEIWRNLHSLETNGTGHAHEAYDPFFQATMDAHFLTVVINLYILGDEDSKRKQNMGFYFLIEKLHQATLISDEEALKWNGLLKQADIHHKQIATIRNKYFAHREKNHTRQSVMQKTFIHIDIISEIIGIYYAFSEIAAQCLSESIASYPDSLKAIKESIHQISEQLGDLLPYGNRSMFKSRALKLQKLERIPKVFKKSA